MSKRISLTLPDAIYDYLEQQAEKKSMNIQELVRSIIRMYMSAQQRSKKS